MKTIKTALIIFGLVSALNVGAQVQFEESIISNGKEVFLHTDRSFLLKSFLAVRAEGKIYLAWVSANMKNDGTFIILRSMDGENYAMIGVSQAVKTLNESGIGCSFIDNDPINSGRSYYKVMHLDTDNAYFISNEVAVGSPANNFQMTPANKSDSNVQ